MSAARAGVHRRLSLAALVLLCACTDAATRVAYDLESGAKTLRSSSAQSLIVDHAPKSEPDGCPRGYTLQLSEAAGLLVWCQDSLDGPSTSSHITTYHLRFVKVPRTYKIHKEAGEHAYIELAKDGGDISVTAVR